MGKLTERIETYLITGIGETPDVKFWEDFNEMVMSFVDTLDIDNLSEDQMCALSNILSMSQADDGSDGIDEKMKTVIRGGKRMKKLDCPPGKKALNGKCVRISSKEKMVRSKAAKKSARGKKGKQAAISRKRAKSMKKRA
jgi:hypothetical protein